MIKIVDFPTALSELAEIAKNQFGDFVKAVVDIKENRMAVGGELHADEEAVLLEGGSLQENLWGVNLYIERPEEFIEFDSMINVRPSAGNGSRGVENPEIRDKIKEIVHHLVKK